MAHLVVCNAVTEVVVEVASSSSQRRTRLIPLALARPSKSPTCDRRTSHLERQNTALTRTRTLPLLWAKEAVEILALCIFECLLPAACTPDSLSPLMTEAARSVSVASLGPVKMEDRKRVAIREPDDAIQPPKKQSRLVNGSKGEDAPEWEHTVQVSPPLPPNCVACQQQLTRTNSQDFQKDAILRSYKELKKEKQSLEGQVAELEGKSKYHDEHLRTIDAWLAQVCSWILWMMRLTC